ncbi:hypothetical protein MKW92_017689 [Papaver armeniacum]|nr:hypothetical protein MKW92_017689 [Papaver armeniacum]
MEDEEESDRGSQMRYVSFVRVNSSTNPYVSATTGSPDVISHKREQCEIWAHQG